LVRCRAGDQVEAQNGGEDRQSALYEINESAGLEGETQIVLSAPRPAGAVEPALAEALTNLDNDAPLQLWIQEVASGDDEAALRHGFVPYRDLWQLRCGLPAQPSGLKTRAFQPQDSDEFLTVNNRAFHWHPEQSGMTVADLNQRINEPWFNAEGFRLHYRQSRLAGFCWTKIHNYHDPALGEIYVIAVDPDFSGRGLGRAMTLAGLEWLSAQGLTRGMLYVESDNHPATALYGRIGFVHHHTDRAYRRVSGLTISS